MTPSGQHPAGRWNRLNAFVDDELPEPDATAIREEMRSDPLVALQILGMQRLKADLRAAATEPARFRKGVLAASVVVAMAVAAGLGGLAVGVLGPRSWSGGDDRAAAIDLASALRGSIDGASTVPALDLSPAGFVPRQVVTSPSGTVPVLVYEGPHGCRIALAAWAEAGPSPEWTHPDRWPRSRWSADGRSFLLVARGMAPARFSRLEQAVRALTRGTDREQVAVALRDSQDGPACMG